MNNYEKQIQIIKEHFNNISEEELNKNLEKCGIKEFSDKYLNASFMEDLSNFEMVAFIEENKTYKEEIEWKIEENHQVLAA